jgi:hypothetical protein
LSGCVGAAADAATGRRRGPDWISVDLASGGTIYLRRRNGARRIVAGRYGGLEIDYLAFQGRSPSQVVLAEDGPQPRARAGPVEVNGGSCPRPARRRGDAPGLSPLTLEELREAGPLGAL